MLIQDGIDEGFTVTHRAMDAEAIAKREQARRDARGNLAALLCEEHGVDLAVGDPDGALDAARDFALLCEVLGLSEEPDHKPGHCRKCGAVLSLKSARSDRTYRHGLCRTCTPGGA